MLRTVADQPTFWEAILAEELRRLPVELARVARQRGRHHRSSNMDYGSFKLDHEISLLGAGPKFVADLQTTIADGY